MSSQALHITLITSKQKEAGSGPCLNTYFDTRLLNSVLFLTVIAVLVVGLFVAVGFGGGGVDVVGFGSGGEIVFVKIET